MEVIKIKQDLLRIYLHQSNSSFQGNSLNFNTNSTPEEMLNIRVKYQKLLCLKVKLSDNFKSAIDKK